MSQPPQPPYSGQPYSGEPSSGQPHQGQPPYSGQPPFQGQPYPGQPYPGQPYPGEPYPGQPNPDVPSSVPPQPGYAPTTAFPPPPGGPQYGQPPYAPSDYAQPQFGQPDYAQPQFGQPDYAQPQFGQPDYAQKGYGQPGFPPPQPPRKSRTLPIVLTAVGIVLVLCVGGSIAVAMFARNSKDTLDEALEATRTPTAAAPTAEPTTEPTSEPTTAPPATPYISITEPKTLGGRPKLTDPQFAAVAGQMRNGLKEVPGVTKTVGALYGSVEKQNIVILAAAQAPIDDPGRELDSSFASAGFGGLKINNIQSASTGSLGGSAKCGSTDASGNDLAICMWADSGSIGMLLWFDKSVARAKAEFPRLRAEAEKQS